VHRYHDRLVRVNVWQPLQEGYEHGNGFHDGKFRRDHRESGLQDGTCSEVPSRPRRDSGFLRGT
jgi:hypothetical protein